MTVRAALIPDDEIDPAVTVTAAAIALGCDQSTVRALLRSDQLSGHHVGKGDRPTGVRVSLASIRAYKDRHRVGGNGAPTIPPEPAEPSHGRNPAHREAVKRLRELGVL